VVNEEDASYNKFGQMYKAIGLNHIVQLCSLRMKNMKEFTDIHNKSAIDFKDVTTGKFLIQDLLNPRERN
jgi:hypothetical protein